MHRGRALRVADNANVNSSNVVVYVGGNYNQNQNNGMFYTNSNTASNSNGNIGARFLVQTRTTLTDKAARL